MLFKYRFIIYNLFKQLNSSASTIVYRGQAMLLENSIYFKEGSRFTINTFLLAAVNKQTALTNAKQAAERHHRDLQQIVFIIHLDNQRNNNLYTYITNTEYALISTGSKFNQMTATYLLYQGMFERLIQCYQLILIEKPINEKYIHYDLTDVYYKVGKYLNALEQYQLASPFCIKTNDYVITYTYLGRIYTRLEDFDRANYYLKKALNLFEQRDAAADRLSALAMGKMFDFLGVLNFKQNPADFLTTSVYFIMAELIWFDLSISHLLSAETHNHIATMYLYQKNYSSAIKMINIALDNLKSTRTTIRSKIQEHRLRFE
ncbi:unnamed protein product [Didymodactylos carnosus]|uniref:Tetratricopeptide repeat protein n=1 Tax=Didymodactylos carnosus TaxID=1234261 RepID=A0A8S2DWR7_9BILA|nr:unnamed protein product [Didymodactylos carnosus]CAF3820012.1 unnamed protein product [Didymodactylos carnosus]